MRPGSALVILLVAIGHLTAMRSLLDVFYRVYLRRRVRRVVEPLCVLGLLALLAWFLRDVAVAGPAVLFTGDWWAVPQPWRIYIALCVGVAVIGPIVLLRRWANPAPPCLLSNAARHIDVAALLGRKPVGDAPRRWMAELPGNGLFCVELAEKHLRLPHLPPQWDGLSILHLSDVHFYGTPQRDYFLRVFEAVAAMPADIIAFTGDLTDRADYLQWLPGTLDLLSAPLGRFFVLGNHDMEWNAPGVRQCLADRGWTSVGGRWVRLDVRGAGMLIAGTERPWIGQHPDLSGAPAECFRVLLSHSPAYFRWARRHGFDLTLAGHLHGGQIRLPVLGAIRGGPYSAGTFEKRGAVMHVSRGLGQKTPLRYGCVPEVTRLVLRVRS